MVRTLTANDFKITLQSDPNGWCEVELLLEGKMVQLGADQEDVVIKRLASAMDEELKHQVVGMIEGIAVVWILSLTEKHITIFAGDSAGCRVLFFQDASGQLLGDIRLTSEERQLWLSVLNISPE